MNSIKNYTTIPLWLNQINVLEVVILLITYPIECVPNKTEDLNMYVFNMIQGKMNQKL